MGEQETKLTRYILVDTEENKHERSVANLIRDFSKIFSVEKIKEVYAACVAELKKTATVFNWLPTLAEKAARKKLNEEKATL